MATKLRIDLSAGLLEVEGDEEFVREIYQDFRDQRFVPSKAPVPFISAVINPDNDQTPIEGGQKPRRKRQPRRTISKPADAEGAKATVSKYQPRLDPNLDVSGARAFYNGYKPKNHPENILIFGKYLESIGKETFTADHIYTCYMKVNVRPPKAFGQALIDARRDPHGFINFSGVEDISITNLGQTHFAHDMVTVGATS